MQATHPLTMTTLSTHDTKRGEDVRARLAALTEIPQQVESRAASLVAHECGFQDQRLSGSQHGIFSLSDADRRVAHCEGSPRSCYMEKAVREAKRAYELDTAKQGIRRCPAELHRAHSGVARISSRNSRRWWGRCLDAGRVNSLAQTLIKFTAPGVPDTYQGSELWDLSPGGSGQSHAGRLRSAPEVAE